MTKREREQEQERKSYDCPASAADRRNPDDAFAVPPVPRHWGRVKNNQFDLLTSDSWGNGWTD